MQRLYRQIESLLAGRYFELAKYKFNEKVIPMKVEYLGEKIFLEEIRGTGEVWVAMNSYHSIYAVEIDRTGFSLPVWSNSSRVTSFLENARLIGPKYEPHEVALGHFTMAWLSDKGKAIVELQINPDGKSTRVLVMSPAEFLVTQGQ